MTALEAFHYACDLILVIASAMQWNAVREALEQASSWHRISDSQAQSITALTREIEALKIQIRVKDARAAKRPARKAPAIDTAAIKMKLISGINEAFQDVPHG